VAAVAPDVRPRLLNLACGDTAHPEWTNVEFWPHCVRYRAPVVGTLFRHLDAGKPHPDGRGVAVRFTDLRDGIPYADESFDVAYHSNFLEHLDRADAEAFLRECRRVLRPGGILRVVVPDLGIQARAYVDALAAAGGDEPDAVERHRWAVVELVDPFVRRELGGEMQAWMDAGWPDGPRAAPIERTRPAPSLRSRLRWALIGRPTPESTGEAHRWAWDRVSLARALVEAGFGPPDFLAPDESRIPGWERFRLDLAEDGSARHFDCLYAEAVRQ
jgi:SAM-dependent methyltransferase